MATSTGYALSNLYQGTANIGLALSYPSYPKRRRVRFFGQVIRSLDGSTKRVIFVDLPGADNMAVSLGQPSGGCIGFRQAVWVIEMIDRIETQVPRYQPNQTMPWTAPNSWATSVTAAPNWIYQPSTTTTTGPTWTSQAPGTNVVGTSGGIITSPHISWPQGGANGSSGI